MQSTWVIYFGTWWCLYKIWYLVVSLNFILWCRSNIHSCSNMVYSHIKLFFLWFVYIKVHCLLSSYLLMITNFYINLMKIKIMWEGWSLFGHNKKYIYFCHKYFLVSSSLSDISHSLNFKACYNLLLFKPFCLWLWWLIDVPNT